VTLTLIIGCERQPRYLMPFGAIAIRAGHAGAQLQARGPCHGRSGWFSQIHPQPSHLKQSVMNGLGFSGCSGTGHAVGRSIS
jgi:hypothetical protein